MSNKQIVQKALEVSFGMNKVRHTDSGFSVRFKSLTIEVANQVDVIRPIVQSAEYGVKDGLIELVVTLQPEDRD